MENKPVPGPGQEQSKQVKADMKLKTFANKDLNALDKEVNEFLKTIDNNKRFINARNAFALGDKLCIEIWYLETLEEKTSPIVQPFGKNVESPGNIKR